MSIHPVLRVLLLLVLGAALPWLAPHALILAAVSLLVAHLALGRTALARLAGLVRRAGILILVVLIANLWAVPGPALWPAAPTGLPSLSGVQVALARAGVLVLSIAGVSLLMHTTPVPALLGAIARLARPLALAGVAPERVARRLAWTLDHLATSRAAVDAARRTAADRLDALAALVRAAECAPVPVCQPPDLPRFGPADLLLGVVALAVAAGLLTLGR